MKRIITQALLEGLRTGFKTDFQKGIGLAPKKYLLLATVVGSTAAIETYGWLAEFPIFREWLGERRIKQLEERVYQLRNKKYEGSIGIGRTEIEDDTLGIYPNLVQGWGMEGEGLKDRLVFEAIDQGHLRECFDGQNFFDTDHPMAGGTASNNDTTAAVQPWYLVDNSKPLKPFLYQNREEANFDMIVDPKSEYVFANDAFLAGGKARGAAGYTYWQLARRETRTLNAANYEAAKAAMQALTNDQGEPLGIKPTHIVVGVSNVVAARNVFLKQNLAGGESNINYNDVVIVEADRLA
jgi:phage major head subunit gpT-like protein